MDETLLALVETTFTVITLAAYVANTAATGATCFLWITARTTAEISRARSQTMLAILSIVLFGAFPIIIWAIFSSAIFSWSIFSTLTEGIEMPKTPWMMILVCFAVIAACSARDPETHTITWTATVLTGLAISTVQSGHPGTIALLGMLIIGAHAMTILAARVIRIGPARSLGPANAATLLGLDAGVAAYAALSASILQG